MDWHVLSEVYLNPGLKYIQILNTTILLLGLGVAPMIVFFLFLGKINIVFCYSQYFAEWKCRNDIFFI